MGMILSLILDSCFLSESFFTVRVREKRRQRKCCRGCNNETRDHDILGVKSLAFKFISMKGDYATGLFGFEATYNTLTHPETLHIPDIAVLIFMYFYCVLLS